MTNTTQTTHLPMTETSLPFTLTGNAFFADYGAKVLENGFNILPIAAGTKRPYPHIQGWPSISATPALLRKWIGENCGKGGIGINTRNTPAVDIDVTDEDVALALLRFIIDLLGISPTRIGKYPKHLLVFRCDKSFKKMMSKKYQDEWKDEHRVEILGDGQQFVAFHIHPETNLPYKWTTEETPLTINYQELPVLTEADARRIIAEFEQLADKAGWKEISRGTTNSTTEFADNDVFAADSLRATISHDELRARLMMIPDFDDYDIWYQSGMALYHQFDGDYQGLDMWIEWSSMSKKFNHKACEKKWKSFDISEKGKAPITARYILGLAKGAAETKAAEQVLEITDAINVAKDVSEWREAIKLAKSAEIDSIARATLAEIAKKRQFELTGTRISIQEVRKAMAFEINCDDVPTWCSDWVYDADDDKFFNVENKVVVSRQGFDAINDRKALTRKDMLEGKTSPSSPASQLALNVYTIPTVHGRMYAPGQDSVFHYCSLLMANTYAENHVPALPTKVRPMDVRNIERVHNHVAHLLTDVREQKLILSWLAYVVQNPGRRVNWAVLLQGTEGDGKSFFAFLLRAVMGIPNVSMLNGSSFNSDFTGWAVGQCVTVVEELRLQGESRFDVLNKIKPFITNDVVEVHAKGKTQFTAQNTTNYLLFTNFRDALPINENDRRYFVVFSKWQSREELAAFKAENPAYYQKLYGAIEESASALRKWLLDYALDHEFNPRSDAPHTEAHDIMVNSAMPEEIRALHELIKTGNHQDITPDLINITKLGNEMSALEVEVPHTSKWRVLLSRDGWYPLTGRATVDGRKCVFFAKHPAKFTIDGSSTASISEPKVRKYINGRPKPSEEDLSDDEL